ncbi:uncharacterized protein LAESUDRAFT_756094 [Laetiporus sulphureus 93-53]|uniref:Uncharacterized protein n=1 Tax=Laetiporus sulphureus 93-53 TaxID=1314785 RepID=A0A165G5X2_9APHY|nr:uncharacterized protein LAESUDRAFT_756094 [Laetiporus sulphureus 93-53]KZT09869.1 hypothetical protein LAESUDRAFT_756094 [Laetiporus sulphureus 93-53]
MPGLGLPLYRGSSTHQGQALISPVKERMGQSLALPPRQGHIGSAVTRVSSNKLAPTTLCHSSVESSMVSSDGSSFTQKSRNTPDSPETIQAQAEKMQAIISDAAASCITNDQAIQCLKEIRANEQKVHDYVEQLVEQAEWEHDRNPSPDLSNEGGKEHNKNGPQLAENSVNALAWVIIKQKLISLQQADRSCESADFSFNELFKALRLSSGSFASQDSHLAETFHLRQLYVSEWVPVPHSIWKDVLMDRYVNFEKLFASMEAGYDHDDEPKDLAADFAIIKKDHSSSQQSIHSESDWIRVFGAWVEAVLHLYPHCSSELDKYCIIILELFHAMGLDLSIMIRVD